MFRLFINHLQAYFCQLCHKMLCTLWDPIVFTFMEYIKLNRCLKRRDVQIVFTAVGYIKLDYLSRKMCYTNCVFSRIPG